MPCSVRDMLTLYLDLQGELRFSVARQLKAKLASPSPNPALAARFEQLTSDELRPQFKALVKQEHLSIGALLSIQPPLFQPLSIRSGLHHKAFFLLKQWILLFYLNHAILIIMIILL